MDTIEDVLIEHNWKDGKWIRKERGERYLTKDDKCELCGCERQSIKFKHNGKQIVIVVTYTRSKQVFGKDNMPDCWGAKNPQ